MSKIFSNKILLFFLISRVFALVIPIFIIFFYYPNIFRTENIIFNGLNRWDAPHYLYIAKHWYVSFGDELNFIVFPPFYPIIIKLVDMLINNPVVSASLVSNLSFLLGLFVFARLLNLDYSEKRTLNIILLLTIFPLSYFFSAPYAESLFFLLAVSSFYFARKEKWLIASFLGGLSLLTRHIGILLLPALLIEALKHKKNVNSFLLITIPFIFSVLAYFLINYQTFSDPFAFMKILKEHWFKSFAFPWLGILQSWKIGLSGINEYTLTIGTAEALISTCSWILVPFAFKKLRLSYAIFYTLGVIMFTSTGFILSSPRYLLSIPVFFILLEGIIRNKIVKTLWVIISLPLLIFLSTLMMKGHWAF